MSQKLDQIRQRQALLRDETKEIETTAGEGDLSTEQLTRLDEIDAEMSVLDEQEVARMRIDRHRGNSEDNPNQPQAKPNEQRRAGGRVEPMSHPLDKNWGWDPEKPADFAMAVAAACVPGNAGRMDNRLTARMDPPTDYSSTLVPAEGGHAVPPDFREAIRQALMGPDSLLPRTDQYQTQYQAITVPKDDKGPWGTTGPQANWGAEGAQLGESKVDIGQMTVPLEKIHCLMPVTEELLQDAPGMNTYINSKTPEVIRFAVDRGLVSGAGAGSNEPIGFLGHASAVTVTRATSGTVSYADILDMHQRMPPSYHSGAIWLCNSDVLPVLMNMSFQDNTTNPRPVWLPNFQVEGTPYGTILGRPVVLHEAMPGLNSLGDLCYINLPRGYFSVTKAGIGMRQDISIHLHFDFDMTTFRWILRLGGRPWLDAPIARAEVGNTNTWSHTVQLAAGV